MHNTGKDNQRRYFLKQLAGASMMTALASLNGIRSALAQSNQVDDYKSLVCVFLFGGNDQWNTLVPTQSDAYERYAQIRGELALPYDNLLFLNNTGLHPALEKTRQLYNDNKLAFVKNVGNLTAPITQQDYFSGTAPIPADLFSHNHQQELWQTNQAPVSGNSFPGWGGRMADRLIGANQSQELSPLFTLFGNNYWQVGEAERTQIPFDISPSGVGTFSHFNFDSWPPQEFSRSKKWMELLRMNRTNLLEQQAATMLLSTSARLDAVRDELERVPEFQATFNQNNPLAMQLRMVAKLIAIREQLGLKRQIFMVALGGFDTHGAQLVAHSNRLSQLDSALYGFQQATTELGLAESVVTFTASEFGRTLTGNGDGTDHAWSSDYMVMGDPVIGGRSHGSSIDLYSSNEVETLSSTGEKIFGAGDVGSGRFIPESSVEQYGATFARWMGLSESEIDTVFPGLSNFNSRDLGFIRS